MPYTFSTPRFWLLNFFIFSLFLVILYQFVQLTVIRKPALEAVAQKQHRLTVEIPPRRGRILDRQGKELAINLKVPSIYAVPRLIGNEEKRGLAEKVAKILDLPADFVRERLLRDKAFVWLKRKVTYDMAKQIERLSHPGLGILEEYKRFYPQGELLAHVLGFTDIDNHGLEGLEIFLNRELQGRPGRRYTKRDALGREIKAFEIKTIPAVHGNRVFLTIDHYIQYLTERALERSFVEYNAVGAWAIVMEAKSGRILAMVNRPTYDPNRFSQSTVASRRNRAITDMYEPGSVFKIVAASAVLNEGLAMPSTEFFCEKGEYPYGSHVLHDVHPYGHLTLADIIVKSSNIGTIKMAALLEPEVFYSYIKAFGFGRPTGIDLPGEASGVVPPPAVWSGTSPFNIPIGHEILVTAIQLTTAMAVIANGGDLVRPYIIEKIEDQEGVIIHQKRPHVRRRVIRPEVAHVMRDILRRVVEEGTGKKAGIDSIPVAGKTGTAQKVLENGKGYSHTNFVATFSGFAPADDPILVMTVVVDDPHPLYYGGTVAAPVFREVMKPALFRMGYVPPDAVDWRGDASLENVPGSHPIYGQGAPQDKVLVLPKAPPGT